MNNAMGFKNILVATDFTHNAETVLQQALWIADHSNARITLIHVLPDLRKAIVSASPTARYDLLFGQSEQFQEEMREEAQARMRFLIAKLHAEDRDITCRTLLGDPALAIIHAVQQDKHDLVLVGTRKLTTWEQVFVGSTTKRLLRKCPAPVWTVKVEASTAPNSIMAATDFSETSLLAALLARQIANQIGTQLHLVHIVDSKDLPDNVIERLAPNGILREEIAIVARSRMDDFVNLLGDATHSLQTHIGWGIPSEKISQMANSLRFDLLVLGTIGRGGIKGVLLGNTAERVIDTCNCNILAVKSAGFVSPVEPPFWPLYSNAKVKAEV
jgi:universal stress protein E